MRLYKQNKKVAIISYTIQTTRVNTRFALLQYPRSTALSCPKIGLHPKTKKWTKKRNQNDV